jgi:hypothetical protein
MITLLRNSLTPLPAKSRPAPWLVVSLVFAVSLVLAGLLFAAGAQAQGANAPESTAEVPAAEAAPESSVPPEQTTPPTSEQVSSTGQQAPPGTEQTPPTFEEANGAVEQPQPSDEHEKSLSATGELVSLPEQTPPVAEDPPPTSEQTPPAAENPPPASEPTPPVTEQTLPTGEKAPPSAEEAPPAQEETTEKQAGGAGGEASSEELATEGPGDSQTAAGASGSDHKEPANEVVPASSPAATTSATAMAMPVISLPTEASQTPTALESLRSSARRQAQQVRRALAAFGASMIATGSVGRLLDTLETSSVIAFAAIDALPVATIATGVLARGRDGGSTIESHTSGPGPAPGPAPGGAGGGSAAGAGSGAAPSASSMLMHALLQAAPSVMLRLYVSQPPWHTSFFALIPERPG